MDHVVNYTRYEKNFNEYLTKYIYAGLDDIAAEWNGEQKYDPEIYQSYANISLATSERAKRKNIFVVSGEVKQLCVGLYGKIIEELTNTNGINNDTTIKDIIELVCQNNADCYLEHLWEVSNSNSVNLIGERTLASCSGEVKLIMDKFIGNINPAISVALKKVFVVVNKYYKILAAEIAKILWYMKPSVSANLLCAVFSLNMMPQLLIDELVSGLRAKKPAPTKKPAAAAKKPAKPTPIKPKPVETAQSSENSPSETNAREKTIGFSDEPDEPIVAAPAKEPITEEDSDEEFLREFGES